MKKSVPSYHFHRLGFRAEIIERLSPEDSFRIETPEGIFQMTKADFYREFSNVVKSISYSEVGQYHYPKTRQKALKFLK